MLVEGTVGTVVVWQEGEMTPRQQTIVQAMFPVTKPDIFKWELGTFSSHVCGNQNRVQWMRRQDMAILRQNNICS